MVVLVRLLLGLWTVLILLGQHRRFHLLHSYDSTGVWLPNWCFFAPHPARHDFRLMYRTVDIRGDLSEWEFDSAVVERCPHHMLWFPERREAKALFDVCQEFLTILGRPRESDERTTPVYRLLCSRVERRVRRTTDPIGTQAFQFALVRSAGYEDEDGGPEHLYTSRLQVLAPPERGRERA